MDEYISRKAAIAYIREQSEECQKAFEELGGEGGIYADAYNDLAEDFYSIPTADVNAVVVTRCKDCKHYRQPSDCDLFDGLVKSGPEAFCSYGEPKEG